MLRAPRVVAPRENSVRHQRSDFVYFNRPASSGGGGNAISAAENSSSGNHFPRQVASHNEAVREAQVRATFEILHAPDSPHACLTYFFVISCAQVLGKRNSAAEAPKEQRKRARHDAPKQSNAPAAVADDDALVVPAAVQPPQPLKNKNKRKLNIKLPAPEEFGLKPAGEVDLVRDTPVLVAHKETHIVFEAVVVKMLNDVKVTVKYPDFENQKGTVLKTKVYAFVNGFAADQEKRIANAIEAEEKAAEAAQAARTAARPLSALTQLQANFDLLQASFKILADANEKLQQRDGASDAYYLDVIREVVHNALKKASASSGFYEDKANLSVLLPQSVFLRIFSDVPFARTGGSGARAIWRFSTTDVHALDKLFGVFWHIRYHAGMCVLVITQGQFAPRAALPIELEYKRKSCSVHDLFELKIRFARSYTAAIVTQGAVAAAAASAAGVAPYITRRCAADLVVHKAPQQRKVQFDD